MNEFAQWYVKDNFEQLVDRAEAGEAFTITRDGQPLCVMVSMDQYEELLGAATLQALR